MRIDTMLTVLDANKHIVGGYVLPFWTRALDGAFYDIETRVYFVNDPMPIFANHDRSHTGICGQASIDNDGKGFYATVQLVDHPASAWYEQRIVKGQIAFSHDSATPDKANPDGYVAQLSIIGASLTAWPYIRPNYISTAEAYIDLINRFTGAYGGTAKFSDPAVERMPLPARYTPCL